MLKLFVLLTLVSTLATTQAQSPVPGPKAVGVEAVRPSPESPAVVLNVTQPATFPQTASAAIEKGPALSDWIMAWSTVVLCIATTVLAVFTYFLWREAIRSSRNTSLQMARSYDQQAHASASMAILAENSALSIATLKDVTNKQMRAYISVNVAGGSYQERDKGIRFEARPKLENSGLTPAYDVKYWAIAKILPFPLPDEVDLEQAVIYNNSVVVGPRQSFDMNALLAYDVPEEEVPDIMRGTNRRLYIWGIVKYKDIAGVERFTKFCHCMYWMTPNGIGGHYARRHNEAS